MRGTNVRADRRNLQANHWARRRHLAGWAWAVVPLFFQWPVVWVWDMALSALLLALAFLFALRLGESSQPPSRAWIGLGAFWGLALLANPGLLTFLPFSLAWPFFQQKAQ